MIEIYHEMIAQQYEATFCMLDQCVSKCPDESWHAPVGNLLFCQAAFHGLFYTDVYLGPDLKSLREQPFHQQHMTTFADYEELEDRVQRTRYTREFIVEYLDHCRSKARNVVPSESETDLQRIPGFDWLPMARAEVHVYNIRHLQHHVAQLSLRLRISHAADVPWIGRGWRDA